MSIENFVVKYINCTDTELKLLTAQNISQAAHKGQRYGENDYYCKHIIGVVTLCFQQSYGRSEQIRNDLAIVAFLHDVIEDSDVVSIKEIYGYFGQEIGDAIVCITKGFGNKDETLEEYLDRVKLSDYALKVKIADTMFNLRESMEAFNIKRINKYSYQLYYLTRQGV